MDEGMGRIFEQLTYKGYKEADFGDDTSPSDMVLLRKYRPEIYIAPGGMVPLEFYRDYLPRTELYDRGEAERIVLSPDRVFLQKYERKNGAELRYMGPKDLKVFPTGYGRAYHEKVNVGGRESEWVFLKYNFLFLESGLPVRLGFFADLLAKMAGDPERWHQLDLHGSVIICLYENRPKVLLLAQHNHWRSYIFGVDIDLPEDDRVKISFAKRSNEPYPMPTNKKPVYKRTAPEPSGFAYVITGKGNWFFSGEDKVYGAESGGRNIDYQLKFLPSRDPLYVSWIPLGERRKLFGIIPTFFRDGPPGIDINSWPELKKYGDIMKFWYVNDGDETAGRLFEKNIRGFTDADLAPVMEYNSRKFLAALSRP